MIEPKRKPRADMSRATQTFLIIGVMLAIPAGIYAYQEVTTPAESYFDCWTEACKIKMAGEAADRLANGYIGGY